MKEKSDYCLTSYNLIWILVLTGPLFHGQDKIQSTVARYVKTDGPRHRKTVSLAFFFISFTSVYSPAHSQGQLSSPVCYQRGFWWNSADNRVDWKDGRTQEIKKSCFLNNCCTVSLHTETDFFPTLNIDVHIYTHTHTRTHRYVTIFGPDLIFKCQSTASCVVMLCQNVRKPSKFTTGSHPYPFRKISLSFLPMRLIITKWDRPLLKYVRNQKF